MTNEGKIASLEQRIKKATAKGNTSVNMIKHWEREIRNLKKQGN